MIKNQLYPFLEKYINEYLHGFGKEQLAVGVMKGTIEIEKVNLKINKVLEKLDSQNMPIWLKAGLIKKIKIGCSLMNFIGETPLEVQIDDIELLVSPSCRWILENINSYIEENEDYINEKYDAIDNNSYNIFDKKLPIFDSSFLKKVRNSKLNKNIDNNFFVSFLKDKTKLTETIHKLLEKIIKLINSKNYYIKACINNIHIRFEDDIFNYYGGAIYGITIKKIDAVISTEGKYKKDMFTITDLNVYSKEVTSIDNFYVNSSYFLTQLKKNEDYKTTSCYYLDLHESYYTKLNNLYSYKNKTKEEKDNKYIVKNFNFTLKFDVKNIDNNVNIFESNAAKKRNLKINIYFASSDLNVYITPNLLGRLLSVQDYFKCYYLNEQIQQYKPMRKPYNNDNPLVRQAMFYNDVNNDVNYDNINYSFLNKRKLIVRDWLYYFVMFYRFKKAMYIKPYKNKLQEEFSKYYNICCSDAILSEMAENNDNKENKSINKSINKSRITNISASNTAKNKSSFNNKRKESQSSVANIVTCNNSDIFLNLFMDIKGIYLNIYENNINFFKGNLGDRLLININSPSLKITSNFKDSVTFESNIDVLKIINIVNNKEIVLNIPNKFNDNDYNISNACYVDMNHNNKTVHKESVISSFNVKNSNYVANNCLIDKEEKLIMNNILETSCNNDARSYNNYNYNYSNFTDVVEKYAYNNIANNNKRLALFNEVHSNVIKCDKPNKKSLLSLFADDIGINYSNNSNNKNYIQENKSNLTNNKKIVFRNAMRSNLIGNTNISINSPNRQRITVNNKNNKINTANNFSNLNNLSKNKISFTNYNLTNSNVNYNYNNNTTKSNNIKSINSPDYNYNNSLNKHIALKNNNNNIVKIPEDNNFISMFYIKSILNKSNYNDIKVKDSISSSIKGIKITLNEHDMNNILKILSGYTLLVKKVLKNKFDINTKISIKKNKSNDINSTDNFDAAITFNKMDSMKNNNYNQANKTKTNFNNNSSTSTSKVKNNYLSESYNMHKNIIALLKEKANLNKSIVSNKNNTITKDKNTSSVIKSSLVESVDNKLLTNITGIPYLKEYLLYLEEETKKYEESKYYKINNLSLLSNKKSNYYSSNALSKLFDNNSLFNFFEEHLIDIYLENNMFNLSVYTSDNNYNVKQKLGGIYSIKNIYRFNTTENGNMIARINDSKVELSNIKSWKDICDKVFKIIEDKLSMFKITIEPFIQLHANEIDLKTKVDVEREYNLNDN